jgi:DEAD/DEAH box helicase domain-containing protein
VGLWWAAPRALEETLRRRGEHFLGSLHASEHAGISLFPILALCDRGDIGGISYPLHPQMGTGAVFIYDGHPGGVGIAARGFEDLTDLLGRVLFLIEGCPCETGCPSCVQSPKCGNGNRPLDKAGAARTLRLLLGQEEPVVEWGEAVTVTLVADPHPDPSPVPSHPPFPGEGEPPPTQEAQPLPPGIEIPGYQQPSHPGLSPGQGRPQVARDFNPGRAPAETEGPGHRHAHLRTGLETPSEPLQISSPLLPAFPLSRVGRGVGVRERNTILFDLETLRSATDVGGWDKAHRMGVAIGVLCFLEEGRFEVYGEGQVRALIDALRGASLVIGYNIKRFDYHVLSGYTGEDFARLFPTFDLLEDVAARLGFRVGMGHLAQETLGVGKSADGLQSLEWVRQGRLDLVEQYCRRDVEILRDLYLHGRREGFLLYRDKKRDVRLRLGVEW